MSNGNIPPSDTIINFYDNYVPSLKDGQYTITLSQKLDPGNSSIPTAPQDPVKQTFLVNGPRFALPPNDVNHVFPNPGITGVFDTYMPQIVMNEQALAWERNLNLNPIDPSMPWMALLVFSQDELPAPLPKPAAGSQQNPTLSSNTLLEEVLHPPSGILGPTLTMEVNEDPTKIYCKTIDIPVNTFNTILPSLNDAKFLAHTRQVSLANKAVVAGQTGFFSAVIANRFAVGPTPPAKLNTNIAHLVSLEGFEEHLNQDGPPNVTGVTTVRMISLYSWTFNVQGDPSEDFSQLMNHLVLPESVDGTELLLRMPLPDHAVLANDSITASAVQARLTKGYVPLSYEMLSGDQSFAWYRGPFSPIPVTRFMEDASTPAGNPAVPYTTANAMVFDPSTGIFDQSYATAFQTGRSLALASKSFTTSLINWRKSAHSLVDTILEYMTSSVYSAKMIQDGLIDSNGQLTAKGVTDLAKILHTEVVTGAFTNFFASEFYDKLAKTIGKQAGFDTADNTVIIQEAPMVSPTGPSDLLDLMQEPLIVNLLQHLSGFDNLGTISAALSTDDESITLNASGISESIAAGTPLILYNPDGTQSTQVRVSANAAKNATTINIDKYDGATFPANSTIQVQDTNQDAAAVVSWLAKTSLLYNVPFNNIIANPNLLPQETIRFFYLDQNWTDALLDGALSIGIQSSRDALFSQLMRDTLYKKVATAMAEVRDELLGIAADGHTPTVTQPTGFLLRSQNITNYPGLQITAQSSSGNLMKPLRFDRLSANLMLVIYPDIPTEIVFAQPSEGLVFGVEKLDDKEEILLRFIPGVTGFTPENIGTPIEGTTISQEQIQAAMRDTTTQVLNIAGDKGLVGIIQTALPANPTLTPASFAVEMVSVPEQMVFTSLT